MKQYLKLETCKKLVELGCTSQGDWFYEDDNENPICYEGLLFDDRTNEKIPAFEFEDFAGPSEHAFHNRNFISDFEEETLKQKLVKNGADWVKIIEEAIND